MRLLRDMNYRLVNLSNSDAYIVSRTQKNIISIEKRDSDKYV